MTERIENENNVLVGEVECPASRTHIFKSLDALLDYAKVFKITNFNARSGYNQKGNIVYQITYSTQDN